MQYKTVRIDNSQFTSHGRESQIGTYHEQIINKEAMEGWKLLGIHNITMKVSNGCIKACLGKPSRLINVDILIFFRE